MTQYQIAVSLEANNPDYLLSAGKMARTLGNYPAAKNWLEKLLQINQEVNKENFELALTNHELGLVHSNMGEYTKAIPLYQRSLITYENLVGKDLPFVANTLNNLAAIYYNKASTRRPSLYINVRCLFKKNHLVRTTPP